MHAEVENLLRSARTQGELQDILYNLCEPCGPVVRTDLLSGSDEPSQVMCVVHMADRLAADRVANRCGADAFGNRLVVFKYEAPKGFAGA